MFRIPIVTKYLLLANIAAWLLCGVLQLSAGIDLNGALGLHYVLAPDFRAYQLVTYMFMHGGFVHLFFNMFALWMFGGVVERRLGTKRYIIYYMVCGIGAGLFQEAAQTGEFIVLCREQIPAFHLNELLTVAHNSAAILNLWTTVGASGAIYALLLAFGMLFPEQRIFIFPLPVPIKARWFVFFYAAIELVSAISSSGDGVAHVAHLGGMVFGWFLIRYFTKHENDFGFVRYKEIKPKVRTKETAEWDYNAAERDRQRQVDAILDKIRKSGYDSLSDEEKQKLFDNSK